MVSPVRESAVSISVLPTPHPGVGNMSCQALMALVTPISRTDVDSRVMSKCDEDGPTAVLHDPSDGGQLRMFVENVVSKENRWTRKHNMP